jgi:hypothetical protein
MADTIAQLIDLLEKLGEVVVKPAPHDVVNTIEAKAGV